MRPGPRPLCGRPPGWFPAIVRSRRELSLLLLQAKRFGDAAAVAREAAEISGDNAEAYAHLAHVLARTDDLEGAETALRRASGLAPRKTEYRLALSDVLARQRRLDEALAGCARPCRTTPTVPGRSGIWRTSCN